MTIWAMLLVEAGAPSRTQSRHAPFKERRVVSWKYIVYNPMKREQIAQLITRPPQTSYVGPRLRMKCPREWAEEASCELRTWGA